MGKIVLTNFSNEVKIQYPKELIFLFKQSKSRWFQSALSFDNNNKILTLLITDMSWGSCMELPCLAGISNIRSKRKSHLAVLGYTSNYIRNKERWLDNKLNSISFCVKKGKGYSFCEKMELDYKIYQNPEGEILILSSVLLDNVVINSFSGIIEDSKRILQNTVNKIVPIPSNKFYSAIEEVNEIYYFRDFNEGDFSYVTKDKFAYAVYNNQNVDSPSLQRKMSVGKFFKDHFPDITEATINAFIEYNKMLTSYDPSLFSIVSGDDIIKYYNQANYFRMSGELSSSCMRDSSKSNVIKFYSKNSNFRLLIMKAGQTDSIMARALLVTTTDGTVFMDRVYTVDTKLINLFHRYAKENNIENIYEHRKYDGSVKNLFNQGPINWTKEYDDNYKVDLDWLPDTFSTNRVTKYKECLLQHSSISSSYDIPYIDNFQYINAFTMQASVNRLNFFAVCDLSGELIDTAYVFYGNDSLYDQRFVDTSVSPPVLLPDVVTLDDAPVIPTGKPVTLTSDAFDFSNYRVYNLSELEESEESEEEFDDDDWEDADTNPEQETEENPYTVDMGRSLTREELARLMSAVSPEVQSILTQINYIATDSQQEQHIIFYHNV